MANSFIVLLLPLILCCPLSSSSFDILSEGSSLSVETTDDVLTSADGTFSAGFHPIGQNAYCFTIWFNKPSCSYNCTLVWTANRDHPVNGRQSKLSLIKTGNLVLTDARNIIVWATNTVSLSPTHLKLYDSGNLVLHDFEGVKLWQSFDSPTDTLLPLQQFNKDSTLVSSRSQINYSSGFFNFYFDTDNVLCLLYDGPEVSSVYWPSPWLLRLEAGRSTYNDSRIAVLDTLGNFSSTDDFTFKSADYGSKIQRRLKLDFDGNIRIYSLSEGGETWVVSWQAFPQPCLVHGSCGTNSICSFIPNYGFQFLAIKTNQPYATYCYPKTQLWNGHREPSYFADFYLKLPKANLSSYNKPVNDYKLECSARVEQLDRTYPKSPENSSLKFVLWSACVIGGIEFVIIFLVWYFLFRTHQDSRRTGGYHLATACFRKFTYAELEKGTNGFRKEIGRGSGGIVYKGKLSDDRIAAIKRLIDANHGEAEFLAEVNTIGKLNHMNLIDLWGYCVEGKHKLLVYEYMEHGSMAENLSSKTLDWKKRFQIAVGTAKGLAYLHEECLEWILHCDIKPQNILIDSNYQPKVSDFGLSRLLNRGDDKYSKISRLRGTRGYMAPEWVFNMPITSKVDVYSYGIVLLELVTGRNPSMGGVHRIDGEKVMQRTLTKWVRDHTSLTETWMGVIIDPALDGKYDKAEISILVKVALQCVQEDKDARPTMGEVVQMLLRIGEKQ
ncbi:hypothetical protein CRYUN_Cryun35bG0035500 [Craigia yunnanensis]